MSIEENIQAVEKNMALACQRAGRNRADVQLIAVTKYVEPERIAEACGTIAVSEEVFRAVTEKTVKKGDVLTVAQVAGIMGCKQTSSLIPMCHPLNLTKVSLTFSQDPEARTFTARCTVKTTGRTGVEMEALTGVSTALLTVYDMCKAIDKRMVMSEIHLVEKHGGKSGDFFFEEAGK